VQRLRLQAALRDAARSADARTRAARAAARFDAALRETLSEEGVAAEDADDELAWLMEAAMR